MAATVPADTRLVSSGHAWLESCMVEEGVNSRIPYCTSYCRSLRTCLYEVLCRVSFAAGHHLPHPTNQLPGRRARLGQLTTASPSFPSVIGITALCTTPSPPPLLSGICDGELHPETKQAATAAAPNSLALPSARADARLWLNAQQTRIASAALARAHYPLRSALLSARADTAAAAACPCRVVWCCVVLRRACLPACLLAAAAPAGAERARKQLFMQRSTHIPDTGLRLLACFSVADPPFASDSDLCSRTLRLVCVRAARLLQDDS